MRRDDLLATAQTFLFVPGNRPDRFDRALASGADCVVIDLEDAVPSADKQTARAAVMNRLADVETRTPILVRINDPRTSLGQADLAVISAARSSAMAGLMVPKADHSSNWPSIDAACGLPVVPLIESARGLRDAATLAETPNVVRLALGTLDLCAELGVDPRSDQLSHARFQLLIASVSSRLPGPIDGPCPEIRDLQRVHDVAQASAAAGFTAKLCIHPDQLAPTVSGIGPTADEVEWAHSIIAAVSGNVDLVEVDGSMVDRPVIARAERILARHGTT